MIWDIFIVLGWKGLLKACLLLLKISQNNLLNLRFDSIINYLTDLGKCIILN